MTRVGRGESPEMVVWMGDGPDVRAWVNADQAAGEFRVRYAELFDAEARLHEQRLHAAANIGAAEHVLDIGCGTGRSTRAAGRAAAAGTVLGVDISTPVLELARRLTDREGLRNVSYRLADAQVDGLGPARYDVCISCFGAMFFADPVAAFTNIRRALRPGARTALLAWQAPERNEWYSEIDQAIGGDSAPRRRPGSARPGRRTSSESTKPQHRHRPRLPAGAGAACAGGQPRPSWPVGAQEVLGSLTGGGR
jgi:SAM-dependent methyltransferase